MELVNSIPTVKGAMFANLPSGGKLVQHRDPYAGSLRDHLGLVVPKTPGECRIFIDGEAYSWREGEDLLFDETYLHYAENTTSDDRIILFCDVERPLDAVGDTAMGLSLKIAFDLRPKLSQPSFGFIDISARSSVITAITLMRLVQFQFLKRQLVHERGNSTVNFH